MLSLPRYHTAGYYLILWLQRPKNIACAKAYFRYSLGSLKFNCYVIVFFFYGDKCFIYIEKIDEDKKKPKTDQ